MAQESGASKSALPPFDGAAFAEALKPKPPKPFAFVPIVLTTFGDALVLPPPSPLHDQRGGSVPSQLALPDDLDALALGAYPFERMQSDGFEAFGSSMFRVEGTMLGDHAVCGSRLTLVAISGTYRAIACGRCMLRVPIPNEVATYADLRRHFADLQAKPA
jgi:hypothetical protein